MHYPSLSAPTYFLHYENQSILQSQFISITSFKVFPPIPKLINRAAKCWWLLLRLWKSARLRHQLHMLVTCDSLWSSPFAAFFSLHGVTRCDPSFMPKTSLKIIFFQLSLVHYSFYSLKSLMTVALAVAIQGKKILTFVLTSIFSIFTG